MAKRTQHSKTPVLQASAASSLTQLGRKVAPPAAPALAKLESFPNRHPDRDYTVTFDCPEFTSLCPITGQPDFGHIVIEYVPDRLCLESKSLKLYLASFRNEGSFAESITNQIRDDLVRACRPRRLTVTATFTPRGGIGIRVVASAGGTKRSKEVSRPMSEHPFFGSMRKIRRKP